MKKILIIGATGFIGKNIADYLSQRSDIEVVRYARRPQQGYFCCEPGDMAWRALIDDCTTIINCSGVGLAKIKMQRDANEAIAQQLVNSLPEVEGKKYRLLHLSTIKAFNANNYADAYSVDKQRAEQVFVEYSDKLCGELLRIPAVFGKDDANLSPLLQMAKKGKLPEIHWEICRWYCVSNQDIAHYISCWLDKKVDSDLQTGGIKAMFNVARDRASQLGVSMSDINNLFNNLFSQRQIGTFYHDDNLYHVVMSMDEASLANPRLLQDLFIINTVGEAVPISALAQLVYTPASVTVAHQGGIAAATLSFNLQPGVSLELAEQLIGQQEVASGLPDTVHAALQGSARAASKFTMTIPLLIFSTLFILYVVMGILYESYIHPLTILSTLPSAGIGAQLLMLLTQTPLTIVSLIGILLLAGIVLKNGIMMIDVALTAQDRGAPPLEAITHACRVRFRPIMMTSLAAFLGALPLALNYGGDAALRRPLGLAIAGGLALSQILTLFTTPVVWLYFDRFRRRNGRSAPKDQDAASSQ